MNLVALHREKLIQHHHWQAAKWLQAECALHPTITPRLFDIAQRCRMLESVQVGPNVDPFELLIKACVKHEPFPSDFNVVGLLREALNIVHRVTEGKPQH